MEHNPNPFDFVPFAVEPVALKTAAEWHSTGDPISGFIELRIKALTPLHVVGEQPAQGSASQDPTKDGKLKKDFIIEKSLFHRRAGRPCIPSSSVRGMLRSFLEAATNSWVSQATPYYAKKFGYRHIGFQANGADEKIPELLLKGEIDPNLPPAIPNDKLLQPGPDGAIGRIDLCSFLFGYVLAEGNALKGRLSFEDAFISPSNVIISNRYQFPDIRDAAFMGGAKPSASSWWYQKAHSIRLRKVETRVGPKMVPEFVGAGYRGRKFYYHQDPVKCVAYYQSNKWPTRKGHPVYCFPVEVLPPGSMSESFRIYFEDVPKPLMRLFLLLLFPGTKIKHKIGYGKQYGYGTMEFIWGKGTVRNVAGQVFSGENVLEEESKKLFSVAWDKEKLTNLGFANYLDWPGLEKLARILTYDEQSKLIFTYPPFGPGGFQPTVQLEDLASEGDIYNALSNGKEVRIGEAAAKDLARLLYKKGRRCALHFEIYQETAKGYREIMKRCL
ncbi:MAG: hypothetical protein HXY46_08615 [Syntrophaceae bacterium]|nr:hypothetical protein [Syntrophaceae bacterium]